MVTSVEGQVGRVAGDTLVLTGVRAIVPAVQPDGSRDRCPAQIATAIIHTAGSDVTVRQLDRARTTALVLGIAAVVVAFIAYGASQIETGFPDGGDCPFCFLPAGPAVPAGSGP
jgi:hypothetical protein